VDLAGSALSAGPDRFVPGFKPPATGVSWVGLSALGVRSTSCTRFLRASQGSVGIRTKPPGSGIVLGSFGTSLGSYRLRAL
jgi:hypothetical protein